MTATVTTDLKQAKADLAEHGYCLLEGLISSDRVAELRGRLAELADQSFMPPPWPEFAMVANAMWMLDDFTPENGATRIVPGSHLRGDVTADQRRFGILAYYCRPYLRTQENWFVAIDPAVLDAHPELRPLLGYEHYLSLGMIDGMPRSGPRY